MEKNCHKEPQKRNENKKDNIITKLNLESFYAYGLQKPNDQGIQIDFRTLPGVPIMKSNFDIFLSISKF